ncbi:MAG: hypothetical protein QOJ21_400, partial [Solirubrobacteraceae bacterium]|nr:hypothetical protein [Solirubrobacteraceae bacterium]
MTPADMTTTTARWTVYESPLG